MLLQVYSWHKDASTYTISLLKIKKGTKEGFTTFRGFCVSSLNPWTKDTRLLKESNALFPQIFHNSLYPLGYVYVLINKTLKNKECLERQILKQKGKRGGGGKVTQKSLAHLNLKENHSKKWGGGPKSKSNEMKLHSLLPFISAITGYNFKT